ncbi:hypothetical protein CJ232_11465 [Hoylesella timonensis]|uniref:Uncharacterized protein n=1 Tax=Hoylesella timonensis TaxID=386414 RepID=A0A2N6Q2U7_9BACT|nr:hypothetical protein CJ232_11465 [Hoylesella timonensis]
MVIYKSKSFKLNLHGYPPIEKLLGQEIVIFEEIEHLELNPEGQSASKCLHTFTSANRLHRIVSPVLLHFEDDFPPVSGRISAGFKILSFLLLFIVVLCFLIEHPKYTNLISNSKEFIYGKSDINIFYTYIFGYIYNIV